MEEKIKKYKLNLHYLNDFNILADMAKISESVGCDVIKHKEKYNG